MSKRKVVFVASSEYTKPVSGELRGVVIGGGGSGRSQSGSSIFVPANTPVIMIGGGGVGGIIKCEYCGLRPKTNSETCLGCGAPL